MPSAAAPRTAASRTRRLAALAIALLIAAASIAGCSRAPLPRRAPPPKPKVAGVRLLVLVVVDQLAWDTLMRYRPALRGGLARLLDSGVTFTEAHHRHAMTATAPGHATLVTGLTPRHHGVVANYWFDRNANREVYSAEDPVAEEMGPANLLATALPDWVRQRDWWGRTFSASGKDRAAVMLGGKRPTGAFWYDPDARGFVTSPRYHHPPGWLMAFNRRPLLRERFGTLWQPLPLRVDPARLGVVQLEGTGLPLGFPHTYGGAVTRPGKEFYEAIYDSPAVDEYLAQFAAELVAHERLGLDDHLDYLGLSFSAVDSVGHEYGPHSREVLDTVLRLDRALDTLLTSIESKVGRNRMVVVLSADHGIAPMPERQRQLGLRGTREAPADVACVQSVLRKLDTTYGQRDWFSYDLYLDAVQVARSRVPRAELDRRIQAWLGACPNVERVWTRAELTPDRPTKDTSLAFQRASYLPSRSPDFVIQWKPWFVDRLTGTTHKTPYPYDTHVPLVIRVPRVPPHAVREPVATADLAPTLASLLGLRPPRKLDGVDRSELVLQPKQ
ncbi:MAG TPA: alkaline phosphatase family protein [Thermoanaerobaculia bacterium]|jgi:predicted AlkP superfamily pyrophosphatase or phosphodiesterase|nr:alkaline phosphatase family protein [Thermoanaerobaculia bacterium]